MFFTNRVKWRVLKEQRKQLVCSALKLSIYNKVMVGVLQIHKELRLKN